MKRKLPLYDIVFIACAVVLLTACAILFHSGLPTLICTVLGIVGSVLNAQGRKYCYILTFVSSLLYAFISLSQRFYGEAILHFCFVSPLSLYSFLRWFRPGKKTEAADVFHMSNKAVMLLLAAIAAVTVGYGFALKAMNSALPFLNALSTAVALSANVLSSRRMREQWYAQLGSNAVLIVIWLISLGGDSSNLPLLIQNLLFLVCNSRGVLLWSRLTKGIDKPEKYGKISADMQTH